MRLAASCAPAPPFVLAPDREATVIRSVLARTPRTFRGVEVTAVVAPAVAVVDLVVKVVRRMLPSFGRQRKHRSVRRRVRRSTRGPTRARPRSSSGRRG